MDSKALTAGNKGSVGHLDALGRTAGARRVHDGEQVLGAGRYRVDGVFLAKPANLGDADNVEIGALLSEVLDGVAGREDGGVVVDDSLDGFRVVERFEGRLDEVRVNVHGDGVGLAERVLDTAGAEGVVGGDDGHGL